MKSILRATKILKFGIIALQGVAIALAVMEALKQNKASSDKNFGPDQDRDLVDETSWESFPASDPPSWNRTTT